MVPHPLDQEPPSDPPHVIRGTIPVVQHLPRVRPAPARPIDPLAQICYLHRKTRVLTRVPRVHQRVRRQFRHLVRDHAHHPVHPDVAVRRQSGLHPRHVLRHREWVRAHAGAQLGGVPHPRVRERVPHDRREGEVVEAAHVVAEVLDVHVVRRQQEVDAALGVDREGARGGGDRRFYDRLHGEARELPPVGVEPVVLLRPDPDGSGGVGAGLVGVEPDGPPPAGDRRPPETGSGYGADELADDALLGAAPRTVPNGVDGDVAGEDGAHVIPHCDEFRRALVLFGPAEEGVCRVGPGIGPRPPAGDGPGPEPAEDKEEEEEELGRDRYFRRGIGGGVGPINGGAVSCDCVSGGFSGSRLVLAGKRGWGSGIVWGFRGFFKKKSFLSPD
ncbi:glycosyl hydrolase superfamily protein [Striga asiatica]|uniref:Glycosyl hydrolase superfamily protein n=1 Tax=Striga asiatica TaxID=4170 RepID=A0A5A7PQK6_STRAF|nr:glycosyl hydrolase superfamily protein [Striga asiatica]